MSKSSERKKPCLFLYDDGEEGPKMVKPDVSCDKHCSHCAWNPAEKERRLKEGHFVKDASVTIRQYSDENDKRGQAVKYGGLKQLRFPAAVKNPSGGQNDKEE